MNQITHRYIVKKEMLEKLIKFCDEHPDITVDELKSEFHRLRMYYQYGLAHLDT